MGWKIAGTLAAVGTFLMAQSGTIQEPYKWLVLGVGAILLFASQYGKQIGVIEAGK